MKGPEAGRNMGHGRSLLISSDDRNESLHPEREKESERERERFLIMPN